MRISKILCIVLLSGIAVSLFADISTKEAIDYETIPKDKTFNFINNQISFNIFDKTK